MKNQIPSIETVSSFWDAQPCNLKHSDKAIGSEEYFDEVTKRKYFVEPHILRFAAFKSWKGKSVLEIGCGIGTDAVRFAINGSKYTGIDISPVSVELARQRFELLHLEGTFLVANAEELSDIVPPQKFDLIYSFGAIHHTPDPKAIVDGVAQFMDQSSEFRLMLYAKDSWKDIMIESGIEQCEAQSGCPIASTFTREQVKELLHQYEIVSIEQTHIFPYVIEDYIQYRYTVQPWFKSMPEAMFSALEKRLGWHLLIIARLKDALDKRPARA